MLVSGWSALGALLQSIFQFSFVQKEFAVRALAHCESKHSTWRQSTGVLKRTNQKAHPP